MEVKLLSLVDKMMRITNLMIFGNLILQPKFTLKLSSDQILSYLNADLAIQLTFSMVRCTFSVASWNWQKNWTKCSVIILNQKVSNACPRMQELKLLMLIWELPTKNHQVPRETQSNWINRVLWTNHLLPRQENSVHQPKLEANWTWLPKQEKLEKVQRKEMKKKKKKVVLQAQLLFQCRTALSSKTQMRVSTLTTLKWEKGSKEWVAWTIQWELLVLTPWVKAQEAENPISESFLASTQPPEMDTHVKSVTKDLCLFLEEIDISCLSMTFTWWTWNSEEKIHKYFQTFYEL